jgi:hypothetical protein
MQLYMGLTGMTRALYLAKNKDDDDLHSERVRFSEQEYLALMAVAERIRTSTAPPDRISTREDWYECSYCAAHQLCWGCPGPALPVPSISCRQCCHATATLDGNACWVCEKHKRGLSLTDQAAACPDHLVLPGLIGFAGPIDYSESGIVFENNDLTGRWNHGCGSGCFTTKELMQLEPKDLTNPLIEKTKEVFGAEVTKVSQDEILARYPKDSDTTRIVWGPAPIGLLKVEWMRRYNEDVESVTPVATGDGIDYKAAEYPGGRAVIVWTNMTMIGASNTEIRESVE